MIGDPLVIIKPTQQQQQQNRKYMWKKKEVNYYLKRSLNRFRTVDIRVETAITSSKPSTLST